MHLQKLYIVINGVKLAQEKEDKSQRTTFPGRLLHNIVTCGDAKKYLCYIYLCGSGDGEYNSIQENQLSVALLVCLA